MRKLLILLLSSYAWAQTSTPNIGLQLPPPNSNNWNVPLNYNFNKLDSIIGGTLPMAGLAWPPEPIYGGGAPSASCTDIVENQQYYDTSVTPFNLYVCHNTIWFQAGSGSTGGGTGGTGTSNGFNGGYAVSAVSVLNLSNVDAADIGVTMNTVLSQSAACKGSTIFNATTPNCVPSRIYFDPGRYLITTPIHPTGISWADTVFDCGGASSNYDGGKVVFDIKTPAGTDGWWFDTDPASGVNAVNHGPQFLGCVFEDGTVHTGAGVFNNNVSDVRSGLHLSNVNNVKGNYNTFQYFVGNVFNPNNVNGGTAPTSGYACSVTANQYVVTCTVPGTLSAATVAMFGEGSFNALDTAKGRPYQQEIYSATLSGTTLTINLSTLYQHSTNATVYDWIIQYNGHGMLMDGFGKLRTANGNTGTTFGFTQYGNYENTHFYCNQFAIWLGGGGVQSYLSGGAIDGSTAGTQSAALYGTSRIRFYGGWGMNACPGTNNSQAPNNRVADAVFFFTGGYSDTMQVDMDANAFPWTIISENGHQHWIRGNYENSGLQPYVRTCTAALGQESCTRGIWLAGDKAVGSHGQGVRVSAYINTMGIAVELAGSARLMVIEPSILGPAISNLQDVVLPAAGDVNCTSNTNCIALQSTEVRNYSNGYKMAVVTPPTPGGTCTIPYQVAYGTDGSIAICSSSLVWVTSGATTLPFSALVSPLVNTTIDTQAFTTVFRAGQTTPTGTNTAYTFRDALTNTGTGTLVNIQTFSGASGMQPLNVQSATSQWAMFKSGSIQFATTTPAVSGTNVNSPTNSLCGAYYNTSASANDCYTWLVSEGVGSTGANPSTLFLNHSGTAGILSLDLSHMNQVLLPNEGRVVLVGGTVTVSTTLVSTANVIQVTNCLVGGTQGMLSVGTVVTNTSFVINSSQAADTSTVCWSIH